MALTLPPRRQQWLAQALLLAGLPGLDLAQPLAWPLLALVLLAALKLLEARHLAERRLVGLLQLLAAGLLAGLRPDLAGGLLQLLAVAAALAGLLALEGAVPDGRALLRGALTLLLAALPLALVPFALLPRLEPFGPRGLGLQRTARTGLSESVDPGAIAALANDDGPAARVVFAAAPPPPAARYWRVLVHEHFDGQRWSQGPRLTPSPLLAAGAGPARQLWLVEPAPVLAVPWEGAGAPAAGQRGLGPTPQGELQLAQPPAGRRHYRLAAAGPGQPAWRRRPPTALDLSYPRGRQPRLEALAARWARLPTASARLAAAEAWFHRQPFRYSRTPGTLPARDGLDVFLFERREGFCGHYASAFTALMRAAGVPARLVSGYRGGSWVRPLGGSAFLDLRQSDAHAWSEVWLPQQGWTRVDPSAWITAGAAAALPAPAWSWWQRQWWGLDAAWTRWWLGFDGEAREALLQRLLGERRQLLGLLLLALLAALLPLALALGRLAAAAAGPRDPLRSRLEQALAPLARRGLAPAPGETLAAFRQRAGAGRPQLAASLGAVVGSYQHLRFAALSPGRRRARWRRLGRAAQQLRRAAAASDWRASAGR